MKLLILFLLVFPKGGFKIGELPITWGYLLLGATSLTSFLKPLRISTLRLESILLTIPFQVVIALTLFLNGTTSIAYAIALLITFFFLPFAFYISLSDHIDTMNLDKFLLYLKRGILFLACYGIALFVYRIATGEFFEIPFLTSNFNDLGLLDTKCNLRNDTVSKLISTYNNGNIYGLCLLMLLPLYSRAEKSGWKVTLVKLSILLTLSRTMWIGLILNELFVGLFLSKNGLKNILALIAIIASLLFLLHLFGYGWDFIWDESLGGRLDQFNVLSNLHFFSPHPFEGITEIVYLGVLHSFGVIGLLTYLLAVCGPLLLSFTRKNGLATCIRCGLGNYLILSCSDGAVLLIPVMAFFWFLSSLSTRTEPILIGALDQPFGH